MKSKPDGIKEETRLVASVPLELIDDNPYQPRQHYGTKHVDELAESIMQHGLRNYPEGRRKGDRVQVAQGHIRVRAYRKLAKKNPAYGKIPMYLDSLTDEQMFYIAMEENLRRGDLTPMEVARSIDRYMERNPKCTEVEMAEKLSMTQGNVSNMRRVLKLPPEILQKIDEGRINFTMGRELLVLANAPEPLAMMREAIKGVRKQDGSTYTGEPCTVEGMQKSIDAVCGWKLPSAKNTAAWRVGPERDPLFDTKDCASCEKTVKTHSSKTETSLWCVDAKCWEKKQKAHLKTASKDAVEKAVTSIATRVKEETGISQEISARDIQEFTQDRKGGPAAPVEAEPKGGSSVSTPAAPEPKSKDKAGTRDPRLRQLLEDKAGTRAQVLDLNDLKAQYGQLKEGYIELYPRSLEEVMDPEECTERCTTGWHYAFDSRYPEREVLGVCSTPKCMGKKKGAFTRAKNAAGHAMKKAEKEAVAQAVEKANMTETDYWRLLVYCQIVGAGRHVWHGGQEKSPSAWWKGKLGLKTGWQAETETAKQVVAALQKWSAARIFQAVVECWLELVLYEGEPAHYRCETKQPLEIVGVIVDPPKEETDDNTG